MEESIWGPVIGLDSKGRKLAYRWVAHDPIAVKFQGSMALERAQSAGEALASRIGLASRIKISSSATSMARSAGR